MNARGVVLVSVLWLLILLSLLAAGVTGAVAVDRQLVGNLVAAAQARAAAEGGVYLGLYAQLESDVEWAADGSAREFTVGDALVSVRRYDEAGRIDLNGAPPELLQGLFDAAGVPSDEGRALTDAILDWRDEDHLSHLNGAEDRDYHAMGRDYGARDGPFRRVDELRLVAGMGRELFTRVRPALTVYGRGQGINPLLAGRTALSAVPGVSVEAVERFLEQRLAGETGPGAPPGMDSRYRSGARGREATVVATARLPTATTSLAVTFSTRRSADRPFTVLEWREGAEE